MPPKNPEMRNTLRRWMYLRQGGLCARCGGPMQIARHGRPSNTSQPTRRFATFEHVVPLSAGGAGMGRAKLLLTHRACNNSRQSKAWRPLVGCIARSIESYNAEEGKELCTPSP